MASQCGAYLQRGGMLIGQNEDMNSSRVRQNYPTDFFLTHYYVKLVSLLPVSNIHPQKVAAEFLNPQDRISKWRGILRRHGDAVA